MTYQEFKEGSGREIVIKLLNIDPDHLLDGKLHDRRDQ